MILRLFRARLRPEAGPALLARLREETVPEARGLDGLVSFTYGFRYEAGDTWGVTLSNWRDFDAIRASSSSKQLDRPTHPSPLGDLFDDVTVDHYEVVEPVPEGVIALDGAVLGLVMARVKPNLEGGVQDMIRDARPVVAAAGVLGLHVGRRVSGRATEVIVVAMWPDRATLRRFARQRPNGVIDPTFIAQLERWSFETFDCISPERLMLPASGPAVILADGGGRFVEASPGIEAVLGVPGELILGRSLGDLVIPARREPTLEWLDGEQTGPEQHIATVLAPPDGGEIAIVLRARSNCPEPGLRALVLARPLDALDRRPIEEIVAEALRPTVAAA